MQACKLRLPPPDPLQHHHSSSISSSPPVASSLLFEPASRSLALMRSDSSILLYTSVPLPFPSPPPPLPPPTFVPPVSTAGCFLRALTSPSSPGRTLFLAASPHRAGSAVLLRGWILVERRFDPVRLSFREERDKPAIPVDLQHGFGVSLAGSVNVFVLHSLGAAKIWVLGVRAAGGEDTGVELVKCAVIDCVLPVCSIKILHGFLMLGEVGGVRVFPLRPLVKGRAGKKGDLRRRRSADSVQSNSKAEIASARGGQKKRLPNGVVADVVTTGGCSHSGGQLAFGSMTNKFNGQNIGDARNAEKSRESGGKVVTMVDDPPSKFKTIKLRQNTGDHGSFFVQVKSADIDRSQNKPCVFPSLKVIAVHALSSKKFLILDSYGDLHLLSISNNLLNPEMPSVDAKMRQLQCTMKVQMVAVLPDASLRTHIVWIADTSHSLHIILFADAAGAIDENNADLDDNKMIQISASEAVFTSEKIQDVVPLASNAILILGQDNVFAYAAA